MIIPHSMFCIYLLVCNVSYDCLKEMEKCAKASLLNGTKNKDTKGRILVLRSYLKRKTKTKNPKPNNTNPFEVRE